MFSMAVTGPAVLSLDFFQTPSATVGYYVTLG